MRAYRGAPYQALCAGLLLCACGGGGGTKQNNPGAGSGGASSVGGSGGSGASTGSGGSSHTTGGSGGGGSSMSGGSGAGGGGGMHPPGSGGSDSGGGKSGSGAPPTQTPTDASVLQYHRTASRDGLYVDAAFTRAAAAGLKHDASFSAMVMGPTYAQPLYFDSGKDNKDLVIVATEQNQVSAFNAADGSVAWQMTLGSPAGQFDLPCGNISPLGITGTPVIDAKGKTLYLDAMTLEGGTPKHKIHALSLADGSEVSGWPVDVGTSVTAPRAFDSSVHNQRGGLIILNGTLYVPYGGHYGDCGDYHGWVVGVPLDKPNAPFAWATRAHAGGVWAPGGIASDGTSLFVATGNTMAEGGGLFSAPDTYGDGESVIRLPTNLQYSMQDADFAAATDWKSLDQGDADIGGSGPVLFSVPGATPSNIGIALGKNGTAYLLDTANLGGEGHWLATQKVSTDQLIQAAAAYTTAAGTFVAFRGNGVGCPSGGGQITTLRIAAAAPPTIAIEWCAGGTGAGSPIVTTTDGSAESIVWYVTAESDNKLYGFNAETGAPVFGGGGAAEAMSSVNRFQTPIAAKGRIFVAGSDQVYAFTLK